MCARVLFSCKLSVNRLLFIVSVNTEPRTRLAVRGVPKGLLRTHSA